MVRGLQSTVALWYLGLDSELSFSVTPGPQRRDVRADVSAWNGLLRLPAAVADR